MLLLMISNPELWSWSWVSSSSASYMLPFSQSQVDSNESQTAVDGSALAPGSFGWQYQSFAANTKASWPPPPLNQLSDKRVKSDWSKVRDCRRWNHLCLSSGTVDEGHLYSIFATTSSAGPAPDWLDPKCRQKTIVDDYSSKSRWRAPVAPTPASRRTVNGPIFHLWLEPNNQTHFLIKRSGCPIKAFCNSDQNISLR